MTKIYGYFHICAINNYMEVVKDQVKALEDSGLMEKTDLITVSILSPSDELLVYLQQYPKFKIRFTSVQTNLFERPILNLMRDDCQGYPPNAVVWYFHTKGVSDCRQEEPTRTNVLAWRHLLEMFVIWNHQLCCDKLVQENFDTCGINWRRGPAPHYSGNFWWARADYVKKLHSFSFPAPNTHIEVWSPPYLETEMWIGSKNPRYCSLYDSNCPHYDMCFDLSQLYKIPNLVLPPKT